MRLHARWKMGNKGVVKEMDGDIGHESVGTISTADFCFNCGWTIAL